ncbi:hypothetical protein QLL95_gp0665 [Cotonvirus japonicus]|uniref:Uncharacterized protein n=1 Tax=Cotonvirus japonicus TaxID=2811091 RepID=A0ABM7NTF2_9VIRU|nr:hypothetical protein QLL95_gp0665 [Cotonvirus japonicus]BCS83458.1 hypothetical protein [Cotonvirus japonicus]
MDDINEEIKRPSKTARDVPFLLYSSEIIADILLGIILGVLVNLLTDYISAIIGLHGYGKFPVQLILIAITLYLLRIDPTISFPLRSSGYTYGVIFIPVFITAQRNFAIFFSDVYKIF